MLSLGLRDDGAPQCRLPGFILRACFYRTVFPGEHHLRAVDKVLVEQVGDASTQLIAPQLTTVTFQVALQRRKRRLFQQPRQQPHDAPVQAFAVKTALGRHLAEPGLIDVPGKAGWQRELKIGCHAAAQCELL
ncbi:hypothetical protein QQ73_11185 [Candidatus Endoriftia persephone str. Guaymas]|nr:hypothetical protein [Candidatus Endoriftia persephone str. Guaymas]